MISGPGMPMPPSTEEVLDAFEATGQRYRWLGVSPLIWDERRQALTRVLRLHSPEETEIHTRVRASMEDS